MTQTPFAVSAALTAIANQYGNQVGRPYIADRVLPRVRVDGTTFKYTNWDVEEPFRVPDTQVGRRSQLNEVNLTATEASDSVLDYGLSSSIPNSDILASQGNGAGQGLGVKGRHVRQLVDWVALDREVRVASLITTAGNYQTGYKATLTGSGQWSDAASSPVNVIQDAAAGMLIPPNIGVCSLAVANALRRHAAVSVALGGSSESGRQVPLAELAAILGLDDIIVANTLVATNKKGQTFTNAQIWGKHFALLRVTPQSNGFVDTPESPSFGYTFQWQDTVAGEEADSSIGLRGGVRVRYGNSIKEKIVAPYAGYLFTNAIA